MCHIVSQTSAAVYMAAFLRTVVHPHNIGISWSSYWCNSHSDENILVFVRCVRSKKFANKISVIYYETTSLFETCYSGRDETVTGFKSEGIRVALESRSFYFTIKLIVICPIHPLPLMWAEIISQSWELYVVEVQRRTHTLSFTSCAWERESRWSRQHECREGVASVRTDNWTEKYNFFVIF